MKIHTPSVKPSFDLTEPLCSFRTSKAYLWGLIRHKLNHLVLASSEELVFLDAACHSLITRPMFPDAALYYGLDISKTRLASSVNKKHSSDILLLADLTQSFECRNFLMQSLV